MTTRQLGLPICTALVVGNMIGSGVFLLPASLGPFGGISIVGWLISTAGAVALASVFAALAAAGAAFVYAMWAIVGAGREAVYWGFILLLAGLPVFVTMTWRRSGDEGATRPAADQP